VPNISPATVHWRIERAKKTFNIRTRAQLTALAVHHGPVAVCDGDAASYSSIVAKLPWATTSHWSSLLRNTVSRGATDWTTLPPRVSLTSTT